MRGTKRYLWLFVLAMVMIMVSSTVVGGGRIAFSSDREACCDPAIFSMVETGEPPPAVQMTDATETSVHNPKITYDSTKLLYDNGSKIWMRDFPNPGGTPVDLYGSSNFPAWDVDALEYAHDGKRDLYILFTGRFPVSGESLADRIWRATIDMDLEEYVPQSLRLMSPVEGITFDQKHPAFCGDDHFVWVHNTSYDLEICYREFDENGPVGDPTCWNGQDGEADEYPTCSSNGRLLAWAKEEDSPGYDGTFDVWVRWTNDSFSPVLTTPGTHASNEIMPEFGPGDLLVAFASDRDGDFDIYRHNWFGSPVPDLLTPNNVDQDLSPNWAPVLLP